MTLGWPPSTRAWPSCTTASPSWSRCHRLTAGMVEPPEPDCWLHPDVVIGPSPIAGRGLFATAPIAAGTVVSRLGGRLVSTRRLRELLATTEEYVDTIAVVDDLH